ncbi:MAG: family N-acetyltransferase [Chitinophagaceae bacterium]|jgi:ribosomal-protein-alanine N-acetyltransferase|nr:family N-acetyltransferase [Chitinophagaceae bacterium]
MSGIVFKTRRLTVRRYTVDDLGHFTRLNGDEEVMRFIRKTLNPEESKDFLQKNIDFYDEYPHLGRWATFNSRGNFVGSFAIIPIPGSTDIQLGYALLKKYWGRGYATELTAKGVEYATSKQIDPLFALARSENLASQNVLLKNNFHFLYTAEEDGKTLFRYRLGSGQ